MRFRDRADAGRQLASRLLPLRREDVVVLGLPRGGVAVAAEVARALGAPLDVILVRKLGVPAQPELGMGAIGEGDARVINADVVRYSGVTEADIAAVERRERSELERRIKRYRGDAPREPLAGRVAVLVDDGIATGSTARAACQVARAQGAARVLLAVPVAPPSAAAALAGDADELVCLETPQRFLAIGEWYEDFSQTRDEEVVSLLRAARARHAEREQEDHMTEADAPDGDEAREGAAAASFAELVAMMPFTAGLGVILDAAEPHEVRGRLAWAPELCTTGGLLHGGALMALADSLGGICAYLNLPPGARTATTSSATVFTRAVRDGEVTAVARPLHVGRTVIVVQTDLSDRAGRRVAQVTQTQAVLTGAARPQSPG
jgi:putative phosphoribosyl transferase